MPTCLTRCFFLSMAWATVAQAADANATDARRLYSTSTSYCYERDSARFGNCWQSKPAASTPTCTPQSGSTTCKCPASAGTACHLNQLDHQPPTTGRCADVAVYVPNGQEHIQYGTGFIDVTGDQPVVYCKLMVHNNEWQGRGLVASTSDGPAVSSKSWLRCWYPYTWKDGRCQRRRRFLGESCWNGWANPFLGTAGECAGSDTSYDEYSTSCYNSVCTPYAEAREREECTCAWIGWNILIACTAARDECGGHACVLSTGDGKKYCDYATAQNW